MYDEYRFFLKNNNSINIELLPFKSDKRYCGILEHVSKHYGENYLKLILQEFSHIKQEKNIKLLYVK